MFPSCTWGRIRVKLVSIDSEIELIKKVTHHDIDKLDDEQPNIFNCFLYVPTKKKNTFNFTQILSHVQNSVIWFLKYVQNSYVHASCPK